MRNFSIYPDRADWSEYANMPVDVVESIWPRSRQSAGIDVPRPLPYGGNGMGFAFAPLIGTGVSWIGGLFNRPDKWQTQALPLLSQIVQRSGRPAICAWFGDIQGLDQNLQPLVLAGGPGDITHDQYGVIAAEWAKRNGLLYGLWLETVRAWHPDGSTSTHGSYNLESGQLSFTPAGPGSTVIPGGGVTPTGASGPISTNTMLLLGAGAVALYLIAKR